MAVRLDDESPLYQALRRYAYERGIMKLSQAAIEILTEALIPKGTEAERIGKTAPESTPGCPGYGLMGD